MPSILIRICLAAYLVLIAGCGSKAPQNDQAVLEGIREYLKGRPGINVDMFEVKLLSVSFRQNEADATVDISPKGSSAQGMQMKYVLEQKDGKWTVKGRSGMSEHGDPAGGSSQLPPGHPPANDGAGAKK